jgi:cell division protein FtsL
VKMEKQRLFFLVVWIYLAVVLSLALTQDHHGSQQKQSARHLMGLAERLQTNAYDLFIQLYDARGMSFVERIARQKLAMAIADEMERIIVRQRVKLERLKKS